MPTKRAAAKPAKPKKAEKPKLTAKKPAAKAVAAKSSAKPAPVKAPVAAAKPAAKPAPAPAPAKPAPIASATPVAQAIRKAPPSERIVVTVTEQGSYRVNERELSNSGRDTLRRAVAEVAGEKRDARVVIRADARATHQAVVTAMDVVGRMGFTQLDIATVQTDSAQ